MKTGSKRGSGPSTGSAVLDARETDDAPEAARQRRGPASGGTLPQPYNGYAAEDLHYGGSGYEAQDDSPGVRRGGWRIKVRRLPRSKAGRILAGIVLLLLLGGGVATALALRSYVLHDSRFVVATSADIQISGDAHLGRGEVLNVFADDLERNVFRIPLAERRTELEALPWVAHATVMRLLPNELRVEISERVPVAFVRQGSQIGLVDANGVLLNMPPQDAGDPSYSFPVLTGIVAADPLSTRAARMEIYRHFISDLDSTGQSYSQTVSEVDVSNPEDVKALIASGGSDILVHFGEEQFLHRYQEFEAHLPEWKQQYPKLASADMRYDGQIVLEMEKGEPAPLAGNAGPAAPTAGNPATPKKPVVASTLAARNARAILARNREKQIKMHEAASRAWLKEVAAKKMAARMAHTGGGTTP